MHSQVTQLPTISESRRTAQESQERISTNTSDPNSPSVDQQQSLEHNTRTSFLRRILKTTLTAAMNAAVTIFGVGVGVGLILGDTYTVRRTSNTNTTAIQDNNESQNESEPREDIGNDLSERSDNQRSILPAQ